MYAVIVGSLNKVIADTNNAMLEGWKPVGGIVVSVEGTGNHLKTFYQAMIKES